MIHEMKLKKDPFNMIKDGEKTVELRLFDEKRRRISPGDKIIFTKLSENQDKIAVTVKALYRYESFGELFDDIPLEICGFQFSTIENAVEKMRQYYSEENERLYGVLGIKMELTDVKNVLGEQEIIVENYYDRLFPDGMK